MATIVTRVAKGSPLTFVEADDNFTNLNTEVIANNAKVTNATHTGDVTGSGVLTIAPIAISGKTEVTAVGADHVLIFDATDSLLKKARVSSLTGYGLPIVLAAHAFNL